MKRAALALALVLAGCDGGPGFQPRQSAADQLTVTTGQPFISALRLPTVRATVRNTSSDHIRSIYVRCTFFAADGSAIDTGNGILGRLGPSQTDVEQVSIVATSPRARRAECRIDHAAFD